MAHERVESFLKTLAMGRNRFLYGLDVTPDDRLTWSPGGSAYTPLQLAGRLAGFLGFITHLVQAGEMPENRGEQPPAPVSREEVKERLGAAFERLAGVAQSLSAEELARPVPTPWGEPIPASAMLKGANQVVSYFQGQLNYAQLIYGDTNANIPPNWGKETI